jgi:hypothetical protein
MDIQTIEFRVNIPGVEDFAGHYPQYGMLARNDFRFLFELLMSPDAYIRARVATLDLALPAVAGIAEICYQAVQGHPGTEWNGLLKQFVGAAICSLMMANGFEKTGTKRAIPHHSFTKGEFYRLVG